MVKMESGQAMEVSPSSADPLDLPTLITMKKNVIGSKRRKQELVHTEQLWKFQDLLSQSSSEYEKLQLLIIVNSVAKVDKFASEIISQGLVPFIVQNIGSHENITEAALRCLATIKMSATSLPPDFMTLDGINLLLGLLTSSANRCAQLCVPQILSGCCQDEEQQNRLFNHGLVEAVVPLLKSDVQKVRSGALLCLSNFCEGNGRVSNAFVAYSIADGESVISLLWECMSRAQPADIALAAAKCAINLCCAGAIEPQHKLLTHKTIPILIHMATLGSMSEVNHADVGMLLARLIRVDVELQRVAAITDSCPQVFVEFLRRADACVDEDLSNRLIEAGLSVFAGLAACDEPTRKKISEKPIVVGTACSCLESPCRPVQIAAIHCLHSLSRSVRSLRTTFHDNQIWKPLVDILENSEDPSILHPTSAALCNLLLEFSPGKTVLLESGVIQLIVRLVRCQDDTLRLHGIWALMNMAFQADRKLKTAIMQSVGIDSLFSMLSDSNVEVLKKTIGLLRNLLTCKEDIDMVMDEHGDELLTLALLILDDEDCSADVKEHTICMLANICDGVRSRKKIMENDDILRRIRDYMQHTDVQLQRVAVFCVSNLAWATEPEAVERQAKLREMDFYRILQQLLASSDTKLFDRVKTAIQQFST